MKDDLKQNNLTSDLLKDVSWKYILEKCDERKVGVNELYIESKLYKNIDEQMIACFLTEPEKLETTRIKEEHFSDHEMKMIFKYINQFYKAFKTLDIGVMINRAKDKEKLYCLFRIISDYNTGFKSQFESTENEMLEKYRLSKIKVEFIKTIYGDCSIEDFKENIKEI